MGALGFYFFKNSQKRKHFDEAAAQKKRLATEKQHQANRQADDRQYELIKFMVEHGVNPRINNISRRNLGGPKKNN